MAWCVVRGAWCVVRGAKDDNETRTTINVYGSLGFRGVQRET